MKRLVTGLVFAALLVAFTPAASAIPGFSFGVDLGISKPTGDWAEVAGTGWAGFAYAEFNLVPMFDLTGRVGYIWGMEENKQSVNHIPLLIGVKWFPIAKFLYLAGEAGYMMNEWKSNAKDTKDTTENDFGMTLGGGLEFSSFDAHAALFMPNLEEVDNMLGFLLTIGYRL